MAVNLFGAGSNKHVFDRLRTVVVCVFVGSGVIPVVAKLPQLTALGINHRSDDGLEDDWEAVAKSFKVLRSLSVLTVTPNQLRPLLAAATHLPPSLESLQLMVVKSQQRERPCESSDPEDAMRRLAIDGSSSTDAAAPGNGTDGVVGGSDDEMRVADGPAAPANLRHLYFGYQLLDRSTPDRPSMPASEFFGWLPPRVALAGELATPPVGYVAPSCGSPIVPASQDAHGWALA
eukprot:TRINITY_DN6523_c0_g2_i1.p2 TRINITY_DN6523_c0_g2~~TRINITY_DN6523_c0_g2_i1.p2  ORF type:complete len:233 (+),score=64.21 TRINITY_DN6523_c0_g2_i1:1230-1928(+)